MANTMEGLDEVLDNIKKLSNPKRTKTIATKAARKAMNIVRKEVATRAKAIDDKDTTTKVWKNVKTKTKKSKDKNEIVMQVGLAGGAKKPSGEALDSTWYWRFVELGTVNSPANPFMRTAFYNNLTTVEAEFTRILSEEIQKELDK